MDEEIVFVKIGGSYITDKKTPFTINYRALEKITDILMNTIQDKRILLGHGGGSFAHPIVEAFSRKEKRKAITMCQWATRWLNKIIVDHLIQRGLNAVSAQTSMVIYRSSNGFSVNYKPLIIALRNNLVPVIYGECIHDDKGVYYVLSTEEIFRLLTPYIKPERIVFVEKVDAVYDKDPVKYGDAEVIPIINKENSTRILKLLGGSAGIDVTGGMLTKIRIALDIAREYGVPSIIVGGENTSDVVNAIKYGRFKRGTLITW